jgi:hypothetical protein
MVDNDIEVREPGDFDDDFDTSVAPVDKVGAPEEDEWGIQ